MDIAEKPEAGEDSPSTELPGVNWSGNVPAPIHRTLECSLLGMLLAGFFAVLGTGLLDWPAAIFGAAGLLLRAVMAAGLVRFQLPPRVAGALALLYVAFFPVD